MSVATPPSTPRVGGSYYSNGAIGAGTTTPISAGTNVNGVVIRSLIINPGGVNNVGLTWQGAARAFWYAPSAGGYYTLAGLPLLIPPGVSVDIVNGGAAVAAAYMSYDLL